MGTLTPRSNAHHSKTVHTIQMHTIKQCKSNLTLDAFQIYTRAQIKITTFLFII